MARIRRPPSAKLVRPPLREPTLHRPRLYARLEDALRHRVTLITGDAGFGKSTLAAGWLAETHRPAVWVRIDASDNDPGVFAAALLEGTRPFIPPGVYRSATRTLAVVTDWAAVPPVVAGVMDALGDELCIILDDYHLLDETGVSAGMAQVVEDTPSRAHLALLSRVRPDLPLARWRAQGLLAEIGADDLRFTAQEIKALLVELHGFPFSDASLHLLAAKTEGWAAGITLALHAAAAQGPAAATQSLAAVSGSSRVIYEYLAQEALGRQPQEVRRFLLWTSVLPRFSAEFADELLGQTGSQRLIDHLERSHLFIIPLDADRNWYRYHHLFQEFLQRVAAEENREEMQGAAMRAGRMWEERRELHPAIELYAAAGAMSEVARLLATDGLDMIAKGQITTIRRWLDRIPRDSWHAHPRLYLVQAMASTIERNDHEALQSAREGWRILRESGDREAEALAFWYFGRNAILMDPVAMTAALADILPRLDQFTAKSRARILEIGGREAFIRGRRSEGERLYQDALQAMRESGDLATEIDVGRYVALAQTFGGRFGEATRLLEHLLERLQWSNWAHEEAHVHTSLAMVLDAIGEVTSAAAHVSRAALLEASVPCRVLRLELNALRARAAHRRGEDEEAERLLRAVLQPDTSWARLGFAMRHLYVELSYVLARTDPDGARRLAEQALRESTLVGPYREGEARLALGLITGSTEECLTAAALFEGFGVPHLRALALLHAERLGRSDLHESVTNALRELPDEGLAFVAADSPSVLALRRNDLTVDARIAVALEHTRTGEPHQVEIDCLGRLEVRRNGKPIPPTAWLRASSRRLLQYLAVTHRPVHREQIMEALWPDLGAPEAANQLRVALSSLRRVLEPDRRPGQPSTLLVTYGGSVALARDLIYLDIDAFRQAVRDARQAPEGSRRAALQRAAGLYAGDLLADSPYEEWAALERDRLLEEYLGVLTSLAELDEAEAAWEQALEKWKQVCSRNPAAEHAYRGLMRCYLALGRAGEAARAFDACRAALAELDVPVSEETMRLRRTFTMPSPPSPM